jgi:hypothetical protein
LQLSGKLPGSRRVGFDKDREPPEIRGVNMPILARNFKISRLLSAHPLPQPTWPEIVAPSFLSRGLYKSKWISDLYRSNHPL